MAFTQEKLSQHLLKNFFEVNGAEEILVQTEIFRPDTVKAVMEDITVV